MSRPVRACGLKQVTVPLTVLLTVVAPRAGVWIETLLMLTISKILFVAPCAGVWIETGIRDLAGNKMDSRAPCGRVD